MTESTGTSLMEYLQQVPDPRVKRTRRHELMDILVIALCAVIGGADNWVDVVHVWQGEKAVVCHVLEVAPWHCFARYVRAGVSDSRCTGTGESLHRLAPGYRRTGAGRVAIDGKTLRGSGYAGQPALHLVSAWACEASVLLGQVQTDKKSNEITAIPELLKLLSIQGCIVTIDAMGCQKAITQAIVDSEADHVLNLKVNHRNLHGEVASCFERQHASAPAWAPHSHYVECAQTNNHGRIERREHWLMEVPEHLKRATQYWTKLQTLVMVRRTRQVGEKTSEETHYYISSLPLSAGARSVAHAVRSHWTVENHLHWSLDVSFREDASHARRDEGSVNLACLRRLALTQLKAETSLKASIQSKRHRAGWDPAYMRKVLDLSVLSI